VYHINPTIEDKNITIRERLINSPNEAQVWKTYSLKHGLKPRFKDKIYSSLPNDKSPN
jgi:hypothetical protein